MKLQTNVDLRPPILVREVAVNTQALSSTPALVVMATVGYAHPTYFTSINATRTRIEVTGWYAVSVSPSARTTNNQRRTSVHAFRINTIPVDDLTAKMYHRNNVTGAVALTKTNSVLLTAGDLVDVLGSVGGGATGVTVDLGYTLSMKFLGLNV